MELGEVDVVGIDDGIFLVCSAINMATEIAKIFIDDICIGNVEMPVSVKNLPCQCILCKSRQGIMLNWLNSKKKQWETLRSKQLASAEQHVWSVSSQ